MTSTTVRWTRRMLLAVAAIAATSVALAGGDWNESGIAWQSYDKGIALAKEQKRPVCLVFYTEWCGHCTKYSAVFHDTRVVEKSKQFVMIRVDRDKNKELSAQYKPDGEYIPRTYFLMREAKLDADIHAPRDQYRYFYDEAAPESILGGMDAALKRFDAPPAPAPAPRPATPTPAPTAPAPAPAPGKEPAKAPAQTPK